MQLYEYVKLYLLINNSITNTRMGNACNILVGKPEGKRPLERHRSRWENNIKMETG
jgi:hypothetical protein